MLTPDDGAPVVLCATVATTPIARERGLSARSPLGPDEAMVLRWPVPGARACITTTRPGYPLDLVFADGRGRVVDVACDRDTTDPDVCVDGVRDVIELLPRAACATWRGGTAVVR